MSDWHRGGHDELQSEHARFEARSRLLGIVRVIVAAVAVAALAAVGLRALPPAAAWVAAAAGVTFAVLIIVHARVDRQRDRAGAGVRFHLRAIERLEGKRPTHHLPTSDPTAEQLAVHPYAADLDVFGEHSLFSYVSFARTPHGARALAGRLLSAANPPTPAMLERRQQAARELAKHAEFSRALWVSAEPIGDADVAGVAKFEAWAASNAPPAVSPLALMFARVLAALNVAALIVGSLRGWPGLITWGPYLVSVGLSFAGRARLGLVTSAIVSRASNVDAYVDAFTVSMGKRFESGELSDLCRELATGRDALRGLRGPVSALEALHNEVFRLLIAPMFQVEVQAVAALERWRMRHGKDVPRWLAAYGSLEALASFGMLGHDFPAMAWPVITEDLRFEARGLGHPLVAVSKRVANDVGPLAPTEGLIVTGSNMSGKSTLLRSMGAAVVFALAGGPVCATSFQIGRVRLVTSMRVSDSLNEGASRFYAELRRLGQVCKMAESGPGVFFLLDEILAGTNARERLIGARSAVRWLLEHGALGAISTHDLALSEIGGHVQNVHFQEQVEGETMSFDYKLRAGVVTSSNALRLMRQLGLPVDGPAEGG